MQNYQPNVDILLYVLKDLKITAETFTPNINCTILVGQFIEEFGMKVHDKSTFFNELLQNAVKLIIKELLCRVVTFEVDMTEITPKKLCSKFKLCANCGNAGNPFLQKCGKCKRTYYCSKDCQKEHWTYHKNCCYKSLNNILEKSN